MDTRSKKSDSSIITKSICFILAVVIASFGALLLADGAMTLVGAYDLTSGVVEDAIKYSSAEDMQDHAFSKAFSSYLFSLDDMISEYGSGSKADYEKIQAKHQNAAKNVKADVIYHIKTEAYNHNLGNSYFDGAGYVLKQYSSGLISLEPIPVEALDISKYTSGASETDWDTVDYYNEEFDIDRDLYFEGENEWESGHSGQSVLASYENTYPEEVKKAIQEKGYDGAVCLNIKVYPDQYHDEGVTVTAATTFHYEDSAIEYSGGYTKFYGFFGFKVNDTKIISELSSSPYSSYDDFYHEYSGVNDYLKSNYKSAYYAAVKDSKVIATNIKAVEENSTKNEIVNLISTLDFYGILSYEKGWETLGAEGISLTRYDIPPNEDITYYIGINPFGKQDVDADGDEFTEKLSNEYKFSYLRIKDTLTEILLLAVAMLIVCLILTVILIIKSGRHRKDDELHMMPLDRMCVELRLLIDGGIIFLAGYFGIELCSEALYGRNVVIAYVTAPLMGAIISSLLLDFILYCTRNLKNHTMHTRFILVWLAVRCIEFIRKNREKLRRRYLYVGDVEKNVIIKTAIVVAVNIIVGGLALLDYNGVGPFVIILLFGFDCYVLFRGIRFVGAVKRIFRAVGEIRNGEENVKIDRTAIPETFHKTADDLMRINDGIRIAVEKAMQNEKMKTELITNVSHDLKTPLTSIINYVDLLKQCDITDETALSYLAVLSEKSDRLKHLIEDLVEASKASSGAINVNLVSVSLNEFINQLMGEYGDGLAEKNLYVVVNVTDEDIILKADSNLLYRVLENLIVNVKKYAMENTRVYISTQKFDDRAKIIIKNISAAPLNMTPEELKSRFVRGDVSRSTSGNGLGLSIAENLCELMNGKLDLAIDGDLFTATVEMPTE